MTQEDPRILELRKMRAKALEGGGEERIAKQKAKGKMTARERVIALLDPGTFNEIEPFITHQGDELDLLKDKFYGDGVITGYGQINGRTVYLYSQDFTIYGGTLSEMQSHKICRVMDLAVRNGVPFISLIDSGGARIQEGVRSMGGYAEIFRRNAQYSGVVPQISVMLGPCAGGAAYSPALTDLVIMVEKQSFMFLTGPEVIKAVTGEMIDAESLGGSGVHTSVSGVAHLSVQSEKAALEMARHFLSYLPSNNVENPPFTPTTDDLARMDEELNHMIPLEATEPYVMHQVIEKIIDQGSFLEIQPDWARNAIVGLARIGGHSVGIVGQEPAIMAGVIDIDAADKMTRFVRMCDCFNIPLVTFVDSPGFLPGIAQEHGGIIRHGAKLLYAYSEATVPKICIITRKAYGGAYVVMSSKYLGTDVTYAWPSAEIAVLGAEGAANILFKKQIETANDPTAERKKLANEYREKFNNPYYAASTGYVDDIIEPRESRPKLIATLSALRDKYAPAPPRKHGNIPV
ncbi:MAG TPA: acyl-CoA carboxylase subunit beta [Anaerolineales bacterium]|nr:acyl-CoA carboxylase subunit beta [Anaerolineales bacterium]HMV97250.1 acyl-CoA carboxylase subunit beta [Anaerolineales bacterium]HMX18910.1 acyl-CoA carboxylase subunit beta [Anaerolineales bacterium]HMX74079.1 acyl-CoA carboxylase subunit beta [Anaerolineales bacterium]HMZ43039.1 acyl-CoA carboxylase subunit beta [Anaerolineales bacterium]